MDNRIVIRGNKLTEAMINEASEHNVRYKTGDHVWKEGEKQNYVSGYGQYHKPKYGQVVHHSNASAKVKWEDGSETTHNHSGEQRGDTSYGKLKDKNSIRHVEIHNGMNGSKRVTPEEHLAHHEERRAAATNEQTHKDNVAALKTKISNMSHHEITPEHLARIHELLGHKS